MCIIIINQTEKQIKEQTLLTCFENNPNFCGYSFVKNSKVMIKKFSNFTKFYENYFIDKSQFSKSIFLIHFRIATCGLINLANAQPLLCNTFALAHNGHFAGMGNEINSDSVELSKLLSQYFQNESNRKSFYKRKNTFSKLLNELIGSNKLAFLLPNNTVKLFNKQSFLKIEGNYYSNRSFEKEVMQTKFNDSWYYSSNGDNSYNRRAVYGNEYLNSTEKGGG